MNDSSWDVELVNDLAKLADEKNPNRAAMAHLAGDWTDRQISFWVGSAGCSAGFLSGA